MSRQLHACRIEGVEKKIWLEFTQLAADFKAVNLGQGFPDFSSPDFVKKAFVQATGGEDFILHQYTWAFGHPALVKILSRFFGKIMGRQIDPLGNILVTVGAYQALFCTFQALVDEGDEVILIEPFFDCYEPMVKMAGGRSVYVPLRPVYKREELQVIADLCVKHGALCISDEVYEWLVYDGAEHVKIATLPGMWELTITIGSAGKTFSATGWKVGWAMGPDHLLKHAKTVHQNCVYHCATAAQEAVAHGFQRELDYFGKPESYFLQFPRQLQQKRSCLAQSLLAVGMQPIMPEGGYFLIADISTLKADLQDSSDANQEPYDYRFVKWMIKNKGLATIPVSAFYSAEHKKDFENYVQFCFVKGQEKVDLKKWKAESHPYTVSIALPGSVLDNAQSLELQTYLTGQIARACAVFCVDEVVVFDEQGDDTKSVVGEFKGIGKKGEACVQLARILQYLECPQYLQKSFFPKHQDLQCLLNPLDSPHHMRMDEESEFREGVVLDRPCKPGKGSFVNCGMRKEVQIDRQLQAGLRVTVRLDKSQNPESRVQKGRVVAPHVPRTESGHYWGYSVRLASCLSKVFTECSFKEGYDLTVGTSERGSRVDSVTVSFQGLEASVDTDQNLDVTDPSILFDHYLNTCPNQGSRTIRTESKSVYKMGVLH
ncbi:UNVERIFIED_CONTAM: hypothetical protein FKN15_029815 [Acipenser sinensis]